MSSVNRARGEERPPWLGRALAGASVTPQSSCQERWKEPALGSFRLCHWGRFRAGGPWPRAARQPQLLAPCPAWLLLLLLGPLPAPVREFP